ncbi:Crp/Fnr family transcriptional regulator [Sporosarcina sp. Marseille-Q4063]|uniref:Crp/Fnr family transcriptional regulator n=1 Tax=Sporosarcina sp. Marseille-Q4063 TaxID=2810514 RepID=UPI001BAF5A91|nr:Crp/Fnr family transcriptional regulator [Sporosarcina sp. Marseille-Q4063]QUW20265.1 Crp/Fnr family transcriptional regulator [Sporosarcina sp. Marseille-Q4063]
MGNNQCEHHVEGTVEMQKMCISIVPIFNHLDANEMSEIVKETNSVKHPRGHTIYHAGDTSDGLYIVHKGRVKIYRLSETGKEQLVRILGPGDFTGDLSLFTESVHDSYAEAMEPVELCVMSRDNFQQFILKYPAISLKVLGEFSRRLAKTEKQAANIAMETVETRIAMYLAEVSDETMSKTVMLPMSRKDLASHLGTTPETVSRKLADFEDNGWIRQLNNREIEIVDLDALLLI